MQFNGSTHQELSNSPFLLTRLMFQNDNNHWPSNPDSQNSYNPGVILDNQQVSSHSIDRNHNERFPNLFNDLPYIASNPMNETSTTASINTTQQGQIPTDSKYVKTLALHNLMNAQVRRYSPIWNSKMKLEELLNKNITPHKEVQFSRNLIDRLNSTHLNKISAFKNFQNDENLVPKNLFQPQSNNYEFPYEDPYRITPVDLECSLVKFYTKPNTRKISKDPFKILDAPKLLDDFYLNLVDWSCTDLLAVGLGSAVYLLSACTSKISKLFNILDESDAISCVNWDPSGLHLAVGLKNGRVEIWDAIKSQKIRTYEGHLLRVGSIAWNGHTLSSGSKDGKIFNRDTRQDRHSMSAWDKHYQEVCGLRWSPNERQLASGGNDNIINIWQQGYEIPVLQLKEHLAAVKALSWSPHQNGLLASGGGTADRTIRFWNTLSNQALNKIDTDSQVCNIAWSKTANELVSTHGYSLNQIIVWSYPPMNKIATLTGHTFRVLYLAESPHGQNIVTGAGDETLRFWNIFPPKQPFISSGKQEMRFQRPTIIR